jgi:two-component system LytT family response regulator
MNCIIIDDEKHCIKTLSNLLQTNFPEVRILATCHDSSKAYELIQHHRPEIVFLDIEMPLLNGFDLLSKFYHLYFDVVFTTAYDSYAIKAIKYSALDYLIKPIEREDLTAAIEKISLKQSSISLEQVLLATAVQNKLLPDTIALPTSEGLTFASVNDIIYCTADGRYTCLQMLNNKEVLLSRTLGDVEDLLSEYAFFRIHHASLINMKHIRKYIRGDGGEVIMTNGKSLVVARNRKAEFLNIFHRL